ncbi:hypothetical protein IWZ03DRAFT_15129 [Phyllosticta citriasiana]|uniref:Uncharacterized protein n=1 Tax=Phyllosticta citriasiana TaxID=595635 RepID=A0ABR1KYP5_9PEZI
MIRCDFDSLSLKLVSNLNVSAPRIVVKEERRWPWRPNPGDDATPKTARAKRVALSGHGGKLNAQDGEQEGPHGPDMSDRSEPFRYASLWMLFTAGLRHYGRTAVGPGRGESRVQVDTCGFSTFYDPELQSQGAARVEAEGKSPNISLAGQWQAPAGEKERETALEQLIDEAKEASSY